MVKPYEAVPKKEHQKGHISLDNMPEKLSKGMMEGYFGIRASGDGRVWICIICINGISFLRFKPNNIPQCNRTLHHNGGVYSCVRELGHESDAHRFELSDVDTRVEL